MPNHFTDWDTQIERKLAMKPTRTRLVMVAAALSTIAIAAPVSTAAAATTTPVAIVDTGWGGSPVTLQASGPAAGQTVKVTGPTFTTTAPVAATNTNTQVSSGDNSSGGQVDR
jgi:hypothetical protein